MNARLTTIIGIALGLLGCEPNIVPESFCDVVNARASYVGRLIRTEIVAIPDYHGLMAADLRCPGRGIRFADATFTATPELRHLSQMIEEAYGMHNSLAPSVPGPPKGVVVRVSARVEASNEPPGEYVLKLVSAGESRIIDIPPEFFASPARAESKDSASQ